MYRIGIDVGGTFTDIVCVDAHGRIGLEKVPSTPADPSLGVMQGLDALAARLGLVRAALLQQTERIVHGTTVATNALIEHKGAKVGLLTTEGHRDILEMREGLKDDRYDLRQPPPVQLVPRTRRRGVLERIGPDGLVETALDAASLAAAIAELQRLGDGGDTAVRLKEPTQIGFCGSEGDVSNIKLPGQNAFPCRVPKPFQRCQ